MTDSDPPRAIPRARRVRLLRSLGIGATVVLLAGSTTAWGGTRVLSARDHLRDAATLVQQLRRQLLDVDPAAAQTLARLQRETRAARSDAYDPVWRASVHLPAVGDDLAAVRTVAAALDDLARDGLPQLVAAATLDDGSFLPKSGRIDLAPLKRAAPKLADAASAISRAQASVGAIVVDGLTEPVRAGVVQLQNELLRAARAVSVGARTATLLPPMLGADGPRTYLMLLQNLAEVRATGGMPGAYVVITADRGRLRISDQGSAGGLSVFAKPVLPLAPADRALYTDRLATFPADINLTPNFATTGALAREMYRRRSGVTVDGVLATDPVALARLLAVIGPVPVPGGPALTAATVVPTLLSRVYAGGRSAQQQDEYFAAAARAVFQALMSRRPHPPALIGALTVAAREHRLLMWSAHEPENVLLTGTVLAGMLPASDDATPTVGVFLNDGSGAKLGYYLTHSADLAITAACRADGRREITLRVTLGSTAPKAGLSRDVLGLGLAGDPYTLRTTVSVYSPTGGAVVEIRQDGAKRAFGSGTDRNRAVGTFAVDLAPGARTTLDVSLLTGVPRHGFGPRVTPVLWTTPGITPWPGTVESADGCPHG